MGRKKQARPHRSVGILERSAAGAELNEKNDENPEKSYVLDVKEPFFVEIDRSSWVLDEHYDVSEIVLSNLSLSEDCYGRELEEDFLTDERYSLRFRLINVNDHLGRIKLGHWPVVSSSDICLEFVEKLAMEDCQRNVVMVSGFLDGTDEGLTSLVHLVSLKFLTIRPIAGVLLVEGMTAVRLRVEIIRSIFDECESLLDNTRQLWRKSMLNVMAWLRPEVMTSEARYGYSKDSEMDHDSPGVNETSTASMKRPRFDLVSFYEAIKPSKESPTLEDQLPDLLPELRPYQRRAAYWMVQREKGASACLNGSERSQFISPLCMALNLIDTSTRLYYNPFSGNVSLHLLDTVPYVPGGILADEMGLGKTVELLACIFSHQMSSSEQSNFSAKLVSEEEALRNNLKRVKKERVECICGAVSENSKYKGLWVQCDICDAWQHADCVGYSLPMEASKSRKVSQEQESKGRSVGNANKHTRRKNGTKVVSMDGNFICPICSDLIQATGSPVAAGATLIVCPTPILPQWHAEIIRHTTPGSLKVCVYEGVRHATFFDEPVIDINDLLSADIVLTTYDILKEDLPHDSERHDGDRRSMRYEKRYPVIPTLLTRILWWRICLDEAQMVESNAAAATELALRLHAKHRWCVTGTPIQRKLDDLYGLLRFIKASPFDVPRWWNEVIRDPYEKGDIGAIVFAHNFFKQIMWRSSKEHVKEELQLPPQEECVLWLSLSPIEEHFYRRQHETCVHDAREVIESFKDGILTRKTPDMDSSDAFMTSVEAAKLFNSLLKLRQACCHPQVGSSGLRTLQKTPMTMEEILSVLVSKTKIEGEEALRKLVVALNGLAGIAIIKEDFAQAVSLYKEALTLAEEHSEDFRLDPLVNIHIHHNLAEVLLTPNTLPQSQHIPGGSKEIFSGITDDKDKCDVKQEEKVNRCSHLNVSSGSPSEVGSGSSENVSNGGSCDIKPGVVVSVQSLRVSCEDLKRKFLASFINKWFLAQQEFTKSYRQVCEALTDRKDQDVVWWLEALQQIEENKDSSSELLWKIGEALSVNTSKKARSAACFRSVTALKYYIQTGLDALEESRKNLLDKLLEIDQTMENPRGEDVARVRYCGRCYQNFDGPPCVHCELDELFQVYEARLFLLNRSNNGEVITSVEEAVNLQKRKSALNQFYWTLSRTNKSSSLSAPDCEDNGKKRDVGEKVMVSKSPSDLETILGIIRSNCKGLLGRQNISAARKQLLLLEGMRKEYAQARSLSIAQAQVLRAHDELKMATSRLRLRENDDDKSIDALSPGELDIASAENSSEKFLALATLSRIKGQLRYLKGLVQSNQCADLKFSDKSNLDEAGPVSETPSQQKDVCIAKLNDEACPVCQEKLSKQKMVFQCGHVVCCKCLFAMTERNANHAKSQHNWVMCPTCRRHTDFGNIALADDRPNGTCESPESCDKSEASIIVQGSYSTKIEAVTRRILWITSKDPTARVLVFSSWNDVLDVLQHAFVSNGISYIRMKGGRKSHVAVSHFRGEGNEVKGRNIKHNEQTQSKPVQVLLLLIQHGANGLNLLEAQHVILVEPLLNPAAEAQAIGRVHRIGQRNKTQVHRFIVKDTVEESIYKLNKSRNTSSFISGNRKNQDQPILTLKDVESLFRVAPSAAPEDGKASENLRHLPPAVAAAIAAERRLADNVK